VKRNITINLEHNKSYNIHFSSFSEKRIFSERIKREAKILSEQAITTTTYTFKCAQESSERAKSWYCS